MPKQTIAHYHQHAERFEAQNYSLIMSECLGAELLSSTAG